jgi:N,N'-diacetylchitobiose phosphorylase
MQYGHFEEEKREYVIDRVDLPASWTNYLGVEDLCVVVNHTAGGYAFYKTPEYHRITRFRPNGVPMDRPGHYVYIRDNDTGEYWTISWQPVGKSLDEATYRCRHGLSYTVYECDYRGIKASQTLSVPLGEAVELWDVVLENQDGKPRNLSVFSYCEFSFHMIQSDNQNFQMSLYCAGSSYEDGIIAYDLFYEEFGFQYFTSGMEPDGYDCLRDSFLGAYRTETNPLVVETGKCTSSAELGNNHCGVLMKQCTLAPGETMRLIYMLGEGGREEGRRVRDKYRDPANVDAAYAALARYWEEKCEKLQIRTPNPGMNALINTWTLYQSEINVMFSRFASFIEVGGRTGLGYRDTAQDAMTIPHSNPAKCKERIMQLLNGLVSKGYGLHLFDPAWFEPKDETKKPFKSPTVIPGKNADDYVHGVEDACSDDALWLVSAVVEYVKETGEFDLLSQTVPYADGGDGTVYEHLTRILDFSTREVGAHGICKGLRADWNDCLNLGGGESAMVSYLHYWALMNFLELAEYLGETTDVDKYSLVAQKLKQTCEEQLWDGDWYIRGITKGGRKIGTKEDKEGKVHLESNVWAVLSGAADVDRSIRAMDTLEEYLYTPYGLMLNAPAYTVPDEDIGFVTRVYPGLKENGAIFSHPNPWAWAAECKLGRGDKAMKYYNALCPYFQNDKIEIRESEPYSYCQFIAGIDHTAYGRARHPFMTGSGGWSYFSATRYMLGIRPDFEELVIDPCIPDQWSDFEADRVWRDTTYHIRVENPDGVMKGVKTLLLDGKKVNHILPQQPQTTHTVTVIMG